MTVEQARNGRHVIVVDLSGTPDNRRVMRRLSRVAVSMDTWIRRARGLHGPEVLIFAPAADGKSVDWPDGASLVFTDELLDGPAVERINAWVETLAERIADAGESLWPTVDGICLGRLNLSVIQENLLSYAQITESLRRVLDRAAPERCLILSGHPSAGEAMRRDARGHAHRIRVRALPTFRFPTRRRNGDSPATMALEARLRRMRPRVLIVSESRPMADLFTAVEARFAGDDAFPVLRVQYGAREQRLVEDARISMLHRPRPDVIEVAPAPELRARFRQIEPRVAEIAATAGPYHPPLGRLFGTLFDRVLPAQIRHIREVRSLLRAARPELVVVGNDRWWIGMAYVLAARLEGIPTLAVQDGVAWDTPMWTCATADHIAVNGAQLEGLLARRGIGADRVSLVGQPRYDRFNASSAATAGSATRARLDLDDGAFAVLFATQPNQDASYVRRVAEAILAVPDATLLLRPHPSTPPRALRELDRIAANDRARTVADGDIFDLIAAADVVVVQNSTVALEAALLQRPVITANFTGMPDVVPYASLGIAVEARDADGVTALIEQARAGRLPTAGTDEAARAGIYFLVGPTDGRSAARVADLIGSMLPERARR